MFLLTTGSQLFLFKTYFMLKKIFKSTVLITLYENHIKIQHVFAESDRRNRPSPPPKKDHSNYYIKFDN